MFDQQVNLSQQSQQSLATVNSLNHPIVRATIQAPLQPSADGTTQPMLTYRPQLVQVTGLPNQPYFQVVAQPQPQPHPQAILPMTSNTQVTQVRSAASKKHFNRPVKIRLNRSPESGENNGKTHPFFCMVGCVMTCV